MNYSAALLTQGESHQMFYSTLLRRRGPKGKILWYIINTVVVAPFRLPSLVAQITIVIHHNILFLQGHFYSKAVAYAINGKVKTKNNKRFNTIL